jgi:hypothetical protein
VSDLPATGEHEPGRPTEQDVLSFARAVLEAVAPYARTSVGEATRVDGRPAYQLVLTPRSELTRIGRIVAIVDAETRLPLGLRFFPRASDRVAIESIFTSVSFDPIDPAMFAFDPPPGATVRDVGDYVSSAMAGGYGPPLRPGDLRVFGSGFDLRFALRDTAGLPPEIRRLLPYEGPLASAIVAGQKQWLLFGFVDAATLERDAATLP